MNLIKRLFDLAFGILLLILILPLLAAISIWIKLDSAGAVFFVQERSGLDNKKFKIYKFRTMVPNAINIGSGIYAGENDPRITKAGHFLRKTSLDELPQIFNIIKGEMSFIGPRPTLPYQVEQYDSTQLMRLKVRPGITGWAQVNGRNSISWPERINLDVWYVENWSLWLDLKILIKTAVVLFKGDGVYGKKDNFIIKDKNELRF